MPKHWTVKDDLFLVEHFEVLGVALGPIDLKRTEAATRARVKHLRESGAWEAYVLAAGYQARAIRLAGHPDEFGIAAEREVRMAPLTGGARA